MVPYIQPPKRIPWVLRIGIWISEKITKKEMLPARLLSWVPKAAIGSGVLESLVAHKDRTLSGRILKLIRMQVSFLASCPFCIDMNSQEYKNFNITDNEIKAIQGKTALEKVKSFSQKEITALVYTRSISSTPMEFKESLIKKMKTLFTEREMVLIASTAAQVNYWTRLIQALGVPPAGFSSECGILGIPDFATLKKGK